MPAQQKKEEKKDIEDKPDISSNSTPKQQSKKKLALIITGIGVALVVIVVALVIILSPHYNLSINSAYDITDETIDGVKKISAEVDTECILAKSEGYIKCGGFELSGEYGSNRNVSLKVSEGDLSEQGDGKIKLSDEYVSIKDVAIRDDMINGPISQTYNIEMTDNDTNKTVISYELKVNTTLSESDLSIINTENPDTNMIKTSLEKIDTISEVCIANEDNDPNGKLGKQGSYYIKVVFKDTRLPASEFFMDKDTMTTRAPRDICEMGASVGGTIEVYKEASEATTRKAELDSMLGSFFDSGPSEIIGEKAVIRVSSDLKASEQNALLESMKEALTK